jgi:alanine racemase
MQSDTQRLTRAYIHVDRLAHNLRLLQQEAGGQVLWPVIKANAYGHGSCWHSRSTRFALRRGTARHIHVRLATIPAGYGDGLSRGFSNNLEVLVGGMRCPLVGRVTMDMSLVDVTPLRGRVQNGDEVVIVGKQGSEEVTADELARRIGTINYEIVTAIARRVPRVVVE